MYPSMPVRNAWHPAPAPVWRPAAKSMGQGGAALALGAVPVLFAGAMSAGLGWVGFTTGARERGLLSILGYVFGAVGALGAVGGALSGLLLLTGAAFIPESNRTSMEV